MTNAATTRGSRIDSQSHLFSEEFLKLLEKRKTSPYVYRKGEDRYVVVGEWHRRLMPRHTDPAAKITDMDKAGIAMTALSINDPGPELFGEDSAAMAVMLNDYIAGTVRQYPARFFGLAIPVSLLTIVVIPCDKRNCSDAEIPPSCATSPAPPTAL